MAFTGRNNKIYILYTICIISDAYQAYAPHVCQRAALNLLSTWIKTNKQLSEALRQTEYRSTQHMFTSRQVALIFEYLGEP